MKKSIVIVEDDSWLAEHYSRTLSREGYKPYHATNAFEAIDLIDDVKPVAILLDMLLTGTSAMALLHELQSHADLARIPIVLVTNLADDINDGSMDGYGVRRILNKATMRPDDIPAAIRGVLS